MATAPNPAVSPPVPVVNPNPPGTANPAATPGTVNPVVPSPPTPSPSPPSVPPSPPPNPSAVGSKPAGTKPDPGDYLAATAKFAHEVRKAVEDESPSVGVAAAAFNAADLLNYLAPLEKIVLDKGIEFLKGAFSKRLQTILDGVKSDYGFELPLAQAVVDGLQD
jgi:hypothetical protein